MADKLALFARLAVLFEDRGLVRVHSDETQKAARAALESLAGLPQYEQLWVGDLHGGVQLVAVALGERLPGVELARRAKLLVGRCAAMSLRVKGPVQALQLAVYERAVPAQEKDFVVLKARVQPFFGRGKAATWILSLGESKVYAKKLRGWPAELSAEELAKIVSG